VGLRHAGIAGGGDVLGAGAGPPAARVRGRPSDGDPVHVAFAAAPTAAAALRSSDASET